MFIGRYEFGLEIKQTAPPFQRVNKSRISIQDPLTYSMEHSPSWEANWFCSCQEIPRILWNPKVHHRTHKCTPPLPILSQLHPVPTTPSHFLKICLNIILASTSGSPQWSLSLRFPHQIQKTYNEMKLSSIPQKVRALWIIGKTMTVKNRPAA